MTGQSVHEASRGKPDATQARATAVLSGSLTGEVIVVAVVMDIYRSRRKHA